MNKPTKPTSPDSKSWRPQTKLVRGGTRRSGFDETCEAVYLTSGYVYAEAEEAEAREDREDAARDGERTHPALIGRELRDGFRGVGTLGDDEVRSGEHAEKRGDPFQSKEVRRRCFRACRSVAMAMRRSTSSG